MSSAIYHLSSRVYIFCDVVPMRLAEMEKLDFEVRKPGLCSPVLRAPCDSGMYITSLSLIPPLQDEDNGAVLSAGLL